LNVEFLGWQWKEAISQRGFSFLHVIGKLYTQQEEKNDVR